MAEQYISDLHVHLSLKPANNEKLISIWHEDNNPKPKEFYPFINLFRKLILHNSMKNMATYTQANLSKCIDGKVRLLFCTIYPIERQYVDRNNLFSRALSSLFFLSTKFPFVTLLHRRRYFITSMVQMLLGASKLKSLELWKEQKNRNSKSIDYFEDYKHELSYLLDDNKIKPPQGLENHYFKLVKNYNELEERLQDSCMISGIANLEGLQGIGKYRFKDLFKNWNAQSNHLTEVVESIKKNLKEIKADNRYRLFYITLSHHFNNLLCGQSKSFRGAMSKLLLQNEGLNEGIKEEGWDIIKNHILARDNGYRILIDVKHMSIKGRREYYGYVASQREVGNQIPIISSHSAVNGIKYFNDALKQNLDGNKNKNHYVSKWNVNLTDEDIINIHRSDGLIGILMHDGRMPGGRFLDELKKVRHYQDRKNLLHQQMFLTNIYHVIRVIKDAENENGWSRVCLGSDMDGIVDPFDNYNKADRLFAFRNHIYLNLKNYATKTKDDYPIVDLYDETRYLTNDEILELNQGLTVEEIVELIFSKSIEIFLKKYFVENYLT